MAVYIDPPVWPAHGTEFAHLISDASLAELHRFAAAAGISPRAFDEDHYDVPAERYAELVRLGALEVDAGTLVRTLAASGLRIPARRRSKRLHRPLMQRWNALLPGRGDLGAGLLERWAEPHRRYHTRAHLLDVLDALDLLLPKYDDAAHRHIRLAAWFHDAVYTGTAGEDEEASAALAREQLIDAGLSGADAAEVARLVELTATHQPASGDAVGAVLCDADLAVLGRNSQDYRRYLEEVREEYAHVSDADFATGRAAVVRRLLALDPLFHSTTARRLWLEAARRNLAAELPGRPERSA
jgi:predicted metal-dependent HD superfamily phosphohydrolase